MLRGAGGGEIAPNAEKDAEEHRVGEAAGERILLAGVIGAKEAREIAGKLINRAVAEGEGCEVCDEAAVLEDLKIRAKSDAAENEDGCGTKEIKLRFEIRTAIAKLGRKRLVCGRGTAERSRNVCVAKCEAVVALHRCRLAGEAGAIQRAIEKIARTIAGEHASGAIRAVRGGREAEDKKLGARIPETGNRLAPVIPVEEGAALGASDAFAIAHQARAFPAGDNFLVEKVQRTFHVSTASEIDMAAIGRLA